MDYDLEQVLSMWFDNRLDNVHTCIPAVIETYSGHAERKAKVKPMIKLRTSKNRVISIPPIENVPVIFPSSSNFNMLYPLQKGDGVLLLVSEMSLGNFLNATNEQEADDMNRFALTDCIAIPGLWSFPNVPTAPENDTDFFLTFQDFKLQVKDNTNLMLLQDKDGNKVETTATGIKFNDKNGNTIGIDSTLLQMENTISSMKKELEYLWDAVKSLNTNLISWVSTPAVEGDTVKPNPGTIALFTADIVNAVAKKMAVGSLLK